MLASILLQLTTLLVGVAKGVVSLTLLSRQGHDFYGVMSQFLVTATFLASVLSLQLDAATVRFAADRSGSLPRMLSSNLLCVAGCGALVIGAMWLFGDAVSPLVFERPGLRGPMLWVAISSTVTALLLVAYSALQAHTRFRRLAVFQVCQYGLQLLAIAVSVRWGIELAVMSALAAADAAILIVLLIVIARHVGFARPDYAYLRNALAFAFPLWISFFLIWLIHASGRFILVDMKGIGAVAPYAATFTIAALSGLLTPPFVNVLYPHVAKARTGVDESGAAASGDAASGAAALDNDSSGRLLGRTLGAYLVLSAPILVGMVTIGEALVELVSGPGFYAGNIVMGGIALGFLFTGVTRLAGLLLLTGDKTRLMMRYLALGAVSNVAIAVAGVPHFGAQALGLGFALGFFLPLLLVLRHIGLARLGLRWSALASGGMRLSLALLALAAVSQALPKQGVFQLAVNVAAAAAVYLVCAYGLRLIRREDVQRLAQLLQRKLKREPS